MASTQDVFTLVGKRMRGTLGEQGHRSRAVEMPPIAELICRIDRALQDRRAA
ncbi:MULTISPECIES: hypothetical protein [unclassified Sphingomonas]|uniref:hypothetical protein n=1 Tax=unclassified Sphingomonas TaxID=196159 RepID=UPI000A79F89F|nr:MULTISPECIES: hypothetical protein [unclassified Sphingomonas]RMB53725.1 hypothetical protein C8J44_1332 [Sphingomonas sp. PP-CE-3A-406]